MLNKLAWLPQRRGLITLGRDDASDGHQVYFISYPDGALRRITQDSNDYMNPTLAADGQTILVNQFENVGGLSIVSLANPRERRQVTPSLNLYSTVAWLADDALVYAQPDDQGTQLWQLALDGSNPQQLTFTAGISSHPTTSADGQRLVFSSTRTGREQIWRAATDGSNVTQVTTDGGTRPPCSSALRLQPWPGGAPQTLLELPNEYFFWFDLARDGRRLAYLSGRQALRLILLSETR